MSKRNAARAADDRGKDALERLQFHAGRQRSLDGQVQKCPRCGMPSIKPKLCTNALSRLRGVHIYVCDLCGTSEAIGSMPGKAPMPATDWAAAKDPDWRCEA